MQTAKNPGLAKTSRQGHRWVAGVFLLTVAANLGAFAFEEPPEWVTYLPLIPLLLLMISGAYLLLLPYRGRRRKRGG